MPSRRPFPPARPKGPNMDQRTGDQHGTVNGDQDLDSFPWRGGSFAGPPHRPARVRSAWRCCSYCCSSCAAPLGHTSRCTMPRHPCDRVISASVYLPPAIFAPTKQVNVGSELSGLVVDVFVQNNDHVAKGQPLARLDTSQAQGCAGTKPGRARGSSSVRAAEQSDARAEPGYAAPLRGGGAPLRRQGTLKNRTRHRTRRYARADANVKRRWRRLRNRRPRFRPTAPTSQKRRSIRRWMVWYSRVRSSPDKR